MPSSKLVLTLSIVLFLLLSSLVVAALISPTRIKTAKPDIPPVDSTCPPIEIRGIFSVIAEISVADRSLSDFLIDIITRLGARDSSSELNIVTSSSGIVESVKKI